MGLDMYAYSVNPLFIDDITKEVDVVIIEPATDRDGADVVEIAYWRKENPLHNWMHNLYNQKGGSSDEFNCNTLVLTVQDLDRLRLDTKNKLLQPTEGFFFGSTTYSTDDWNHLKTSIDRFVADAKSAIAEGRVIVYSSWW